MYGATGEAAPPVPTPYGLRRGVKSHHERDEDEAWDALSSSNGSDWSASSKPTPGAPDSIQPRGDEEDRAQVVPIKTSDLKPTPSSDISKPQIFALDLLEMPPITGVYAIQGDFLTPETASLLGGLLPNGRTDVVLSDMAASATGNRTRDVESSLDIAISVWEFCKRHLTSSTETGGRGGALVQVFISIRTCNLDLRY